jgi:hypothetical protein
MQPHAGLSCRPNFEMGTALEIVRALLSAGATPKTEDLWLACHCSEAALGALLLASPRGERLVTGAAPRSWLSVAGVYCPDLVFPLLDRGASPRLEFGPFPGALPAKVAPSVFREARWKLLRTLYLLHGRGCLAIPSNLLGTVGTFLAEPVPVRSGAAAGDQDHHPLALSLGLFEMCGAHPLPLPPFLSVTPPPALLLDP